MAAAESGNNPGSNMRMRQTARRVAYGGICASLILFLLLGVRLLPTANLALYTLMSLCVAIAVMEIRMRGAVICWLAASGIGIMLAGMLSGFPFLILFGPYALLKAVIDTHVRTKWTRAGLSLLTADVLLASLAVLFVYVMDMKPDSLPLPMWMLALLAQPALLLYDLALRMLITLYQDRIRNR